MIRSTFTKYSSCLREFIQRTSGTACLAETEPVFNELALELFELQFAFNLPYRHFCERRRISPAGVSDWTQIPAIPASAFKELELSSLAPAERIKAFHSSGTTAQKPGRHFHDAESLAVYEGSLLAWFRVRFSAEGRQMLFLTPPPALAPHSSLVHMFETVRGALASDDSRFLGQIDAQEGWTLPVQEARLELAKAEESGRPVALLGTAFNFVHLLDHLAAVNVRLKLAGSSVLETGGYKGRARVVPKPELYSLMNKYLGVRPEDIISEYGMSELSSQAYEAPNQARAFQFPPWARFQIISPETGRAAGEGETGLIRVFDLANVRSVSAIQTEDLAVQSGAGFQLLGRAERAEPRGCSLMIT